MACVDLLAKLGVPWLHSLNQKPKNINEKQSSWLVPEKDNLYKQCFLKTTWISNRCTTLYHGFWSNNIFVWMTSDKRAETKCFRVAFLRISIQDQATTKRLLKQRSMIGSNKPNDYHKNIRLKGKLKKESHKTSLFRVEFCNNRALFARFWTRHGYQNVAQ